MYSQTTAASTTTCTLSSHQQSETSRLAVADILSTMANGGEAITPSTFAALEGFSTGVLTQTTPTLTPTTLRSIEQTFIELQNVPPPHQVSHQNEAGFVPPVVNPVHAPPSSSASPPSATTTSACGNNNNGVSYHTLTVKSMATAHGVGSSAPASSAGSSVGGGSSNSSSNSSASPSSLWNGRVVAVASRATGAAKAGRNMGGRRPAKYEKLTPEEEERRRVRRERNKLAAARCRKRRMDHTNSLVFETEGLEDQRSSLHSEIQELQNQRDELEFILTAHKMVCKLSKQGHHHQHPEDTMDVKPDLTELNLAMASGAPAGCLTSFPSGAHQHSNGMLATRKPLQRPNSLLLSSTFAVPSNPPTLVVPSAAGTATTSSSLSKLSLTEATGISISTPSSGIFNFEALMEGGTGLTPVTSGASLVAVGIPTCSTQQRSSGSDMSSPDTITPPKLVSL